MIEIVARSSGHTTVALSFLYRKPFETLVGEDS